jgi:hypothetical protein
MKKILILVPFVLFSFVLIAQQNNIKSIKKHGDSFFGIHFDFHAGQDSKEIGKNFSDALVDSLLKTVRPDYIQVDCKGGPGISSYPTLVGTPAPGIVKDIYPIWRSLTRKYGMGLFVHYAAFDQQTIILHPSWAAVGSNGDPLKSTSMFSPYLDSLFIPQMKELITNYNINGAWIDGESGVDVDYSPKAIAAYKKETGSTIIPYKREDPDYQKYVSFMRKVHDKYLKHYIDAVHQIDPKFEICINWGYSSFMPEPVDLPVDFLSGDLYQANDVFNIAFEARCMALQGKPWDLMSWGFSGNSLGNWSNKSSIQLKQEAAQIISMGGGFQVYLQQNRDGTFNDWYIGTLKELSDFVKAREQFCFKANPIAQIALIHSTPGFYKITKNVRSGYLENEPTVGVLTALLDGQNLVKIEREYSIEGNLQNYPLIVYPDWEVIDPDFKNKLLDYVKNGGNLMVLGAKTTKLFEDELGVAFGEFLSDKASNLLYKGMSGKLTGNFQEVEAQVGTDIYGAVGGGRNVPAATVCSYGKGKIAGVYFDFGKTYQENKMSELRILLDDIVNKLIINPVVQVQGSNLVHVALNELDGKLMVNLINMVGQNSKSNISQYDEVPALGPLNVSVNMPAKPKKVVLQPEGKPLKFKYENNKVIFEVPEVEIHSIVEIR